MVAKTEKLGVWQPMEGGFNRTKSRPGRHRRYEHHQQHRRGGHRRCRRHTSAGGSRPSLRQRTVSVVWHYRCLVLNNRLHRRVIKLRNISYEMRLKECGLTTLETTERLRGDQVEVFKILNGYENIDRNILSRLRKREGLEDISKESVYTRY